MNKILQINNIKKSYKGNIAVDVDSLSLYAGDCLGIVGESGCGKSTLASIIAGIEKQDSGSVIFRGEDITHYNRVQMRNVYSYMQMIFQIPNDSFDKRYTIGSSIAEALAGTYRKKEALEYVKKLLIDVGLSEEYVCKYPDELSGGECQRAAIARALSRKPELLICDEVTSALDMTIQEQIVKLLCSMQKEMKLSIMFICHDLALVSNMCNKIAVMKSGQIIEYGDIREVITSPQHDYTREPIEASR